MEGMVCGMPSKNLSAQDRVTKEWDNMAGEWDDVAVGYATGLERILWDEIGIATTSTKDWTVLDFGCGTGLLTERIKDHVGRVVAVDASRGMIHLLQDKIQCMTGFEHVSAHVGVLANLERESEEFRQAMESIMGSVDLIVASSVLNFIPDEDQEATCRVLGRLLKPVTGILFHSDWPCGDGHPADGMNQRKAARIYEMAGALTKVSTRVGNLSMNDGEETEVFFGVAQKQEQQQQKEQS